MTNELLYKTLFDHLPQKIFLKDRESVYLACNENYAKDLKIKPHEIVGKNDFDFYPKDLAEKYRADDKDIMDSGKSRDIEEKYILDGKEIFVHTFKTPIRDEGGNVVGVLGVFWDITEHRRTEEILRQGEVHHRTIIQAALDGFWINDMQGRIVDVNKAYCQMIGYSREELLKMAISDVEAIEKPEETARHIEHIVKHGHDRFESRQRRKDGRIIDVEVSAAYSDEGGGQLVVFLRDITERKEAEEALRTKLAEIEKLNKHMVGREMRVIEVKKEVNALLEEMEREPRYRV
ncbi:MAG: PAS domain S-box protein [Pseudomonadota bacterium]